MAAKSATIVANPRARGMRRFDSEEALRRLEAQGFEARLEFPDSPAGTAAAAREAAERGDALVFVLGGDGTVRLAAGALAGSESALAVLPGGTANVWAKEAGIPRNLLRALHAHLDGQQVAMDLGRANGEPFLLMAGIGWDAQIAATVTPTLKRRLGVLAYVLHGIPMLHRLRTTTLAWETETASGVEGVGLVVVSNTRLYGGILTFSPEASARDGQLDACIFTPGNAVEALRQALKVVVRRHPGDARVRELRTSRFEVTTPGIPVQLDGDVVGETPVALTVQRGAITMSVPAGPLTPVLRE
ncbi:MAG: diacylglycerol kinase family lipid kinase [Chloroflexi bacterium]|nr:diacylglycerol kinase family lipid kinase [Chloroflexota bacterium]